MRIEQGADYRLASVMNNHGGVDSKRCVMSALKKWIFRPSMNFNVRRWNRLPGQKIICYSNIFDLMEINADWMIGGGELFWCRWTKITACHLTCYHKANQPGLITLQFKMFLRSTHHIMQKNIFSNLTHLKCALLVVNSFLSVFV